MYFQNLLKDIATHKLPTGTYDNVQAIDNCLEMYLVKEFHGSRIRVVLQEKSAVNFWGHGS